MRTIDAGAYDKLRISRRLFAAGLAAVTVVPRAFAQSQAIKLRKLNCFEIRVSDVERSVSFYQGLFGMPVQARTPDRVCLRIGDGPQFMAIRSVLEGETPAITHLGYSVDGYDTQRVLAALRTRGFDRIDPPPVTSPGIEHTMKAWIRMRGQTQELYFADARGLIVQLSDPAYCGGSGAAGDGCGSGSSTVPEPAPAGLMRLRELNHFTVFVNDGAEANRFYQETFGLAVQAYQGPQAPVTGIGDGHQFVMYAGPFPGAENAPANIHHVSFNLDGFNTEALIAKLT